MIYEKPKLEKFGTFRDLTEAGALGVGDGGTILCASPCPTTPGGRS